MNVAVVAGEASGDLQAANLLVELSSQLPPGEVLEMWGIGGEGLRGIGCELIADSSAWGTISVAESLSKASTVLAAMQKLKRALAQRRPDLIILVDFGAFNIPVASWVKSRRLSPASRPGAAVPDASGRTCPIVYYFPPSSWRRLMSPKKLRNLTSVSDLIITPFSWSAELLRSTGGNAYYLGHPLLDTVKATSSSDDFDRRYGIDKSRTVITLLPGSREHEVRHILPELLAAAGELARRMPGVQFLVAKSPNLSRNLIEDILRKAQLHGADASVLHLVQQAGDLLRHASSALKPSMAERVGSLATPEGLLVSSADPEPKRQAWAEKRMSTSSQTAPLAIVENATLDAMFRSDLVIAASGTATLEAAILGRPVIIVYKGSALMDLEFRLRRKALNITYIGLPNILAGELVCPEFLQDQATGHNIANEALELLLQPEKLMAARKRLQEIVRGNLGEPGATKRSAAKIVSFLADYGGAARPLPLEASN